MFAVTCYSLCSTSLVDVEVAAAPGVSVCAADRCSGPAGAGNTSLAGALSSKRQQLN